MDFIPCSLVISTIFVLQRERERETEKESEFNFIHE
jgi:hypothetical protein